jgi:hypothetical protein
VPLDTPLNQRQLEVLRWINEGCPDGRWTDFSFKKSADVLAWRRLVTVSKRGGVWSAAILSAGMHYLAHGAYPPGHWEKRRRGQIVDLDVLARTPLVAPSHAVAGDRRTTERPTKKPPTAELTPTRRLLKDINDARQLGTRHSRRHDELPQPGRDHQPTEDAACSVLNRLTDQSALTHGSSMNSALGVDG